MTTFCVFLSIANTVSIVVGGIVWVPLLRQRRAPTPATAAPSHAASVAAPRASWDDDEDEEWIES